MVKKIILTIVLMTILGAISNSTKAMPIIGETAPEFKADTTQGKINFPQDYKGSWIVLFSHPGDFTPVCTTEFMAFEAAKAKFHSLNTKLIGLSENDVESHQKWIESIKGIKFNCQEDTNITFPIIGDENKSIAKKYGMLQNDKNPTKTVRAVYIIDPASKIRAIIYYPQSTGRYIPEIQRLLIALQATDEFEIATPANWMPGDDVIVPTDKIPEGKTAEALQGEGITEHSPYLYTKSLDKETICDKLVK